MGTSGGTSGGAGAYSLPLGIDPPVGAAHAIPNGPVSANLSMTLNALYLVPRPMGNHTRTLVEISVEIVSAAAAGGVFRACTMAAGTGRVPTTVIADYGTVAADGGAGVVAWTGLAGAGAANTQYWDGIVLQVAAGAVVRAVAAYNPYTTIQGVPLSGSSSFAAYVMTGVNGAITLPFAYADVDFAPRLGVKFNP